MPTTVEKITIALPPEMVADVRSAVEAGDYASSSEVVRDALRDWSHKRQLQQNGIAQLRQLWQEAIADKSAALNPDQVFDELERKFARATDRPVLLQEGLKVLIHLEASRRLAALGGTAPDLEQIKRTRSDI